MDAQHQQRDRNKHHSLHWSPQSPDNLCHLKCSPGHLTSCSGLPEEPESHCSNGSEHYCVDRTIHYTVKSIMAITIPSMVHTTGNDTSELMFMLVPQ